MAPVFAFALLAAAATRIVSLAPSLTEDLFAIGAGPRVVGVDAFSDRPARARALPRVGTLNTVNAEAIVALRPDLVVGITYEAAQLNDVARAGVRTLTLRVDDLAGDFAAIAQLGRETGRASQAQALIAQMRARLARDAHRAALRRPLRAFVAIGRDPIVTAGAGSYVDDLLRAANLANVARAAQTPWPEFSAERLLAAQPDLIIVPASATPFTGEPWARLRAVRAGHIVRVPDDDLLRPGPRVPDAVEALVTQAARWR